jgi:hypothetical protein
MYFNSKELAQIVDNFYFGGIRMKKRMFLITLIVLAVFPVISYGSIPCAYAEGNARETGSISNHLLVSNNDLPCYVGGKYTGNCSRSNPYYNAFNGGCYPSLQDCKKADGDLSNTQGSGSCVRCGR